MARGFKQTKVSLETHGGREILTGPTEIFKVFSWPGPGKSHSEPQLRMCVSLDEPFKSILPLQKPRRCEFMLCHAGAKHNSNGRDVARNIREIYSAKKKNVCS